jgi:hypothetical protein
MHDIEALNRALRAPFRFHGWLQAAAVLSGAVVAPIAARFTNREAAIALGALAMIAAVGSYWTWWIRSRYPPATEAIADHNRLEAAAWRRETGTDLPCSRAQARAWLEAHPRSADHAGDVRRAGMLQWVDARDAARREIDSLEPATPAETFDAEIARATQAYLDGAVVDLVPARAAFAALADPLDRRHGRVCVGLLEARVALAGGGDPFEPILAARAEMDGIDPDVSTAATSRRLALIVAVAVVGFAVIAFAVS